jgi:hypothetical protein
MTAQIRVWQTEQQGSGRSPVSELYYLGMAVKFVVH